VGFLGFNFNVDEEKYWSDDEAEEMEKVKGQGLLNKRGEREMKAGRKGSGKGPRNNKDKMGGRGGQMGAPPGYQGGFQGNRNQNQGGFQGNNNQGMPPGMTTQQMFNQYLHDSVQQGVPNLFENTQQGQAYGQQ
jgi:hypothetical protein